MLVLECGSGTPRLNEVQHDYGDADHDRGGQSAQFAAAVRDRLVKTSAHHCAEQRRKNLGNPKHQDTVQPG